MPQSKVDRLGRRTGSESGLSAEAAQSARLAKSIVQNDRQLAGGPGSGQASRPGDIDQALAEITARQQALDLETAGAGPRAGQSGEEPRLGAAAIEQQLSEIAAQIKTLRESSQIQRLEGELSRAMANGKEAAGGQQQRPADKPRDGSRLPAANRVDQRPVPGNSAALGRKIDPAPPGDTPMAEEISSLQHQIAGPHPTLRAEDVAEALRVDLNELRAEIRNAIPMTGGLAPLEQQLGTLAAEVAKLVPPLRADDIAQALRRDFDELSATLHNTRQQYDVAPIAEQMRVLTSEVTRFEPRIEAVHEDLRRDSPRSVRRCAKRCRPTRSRPSSRRCEGLAHVSRPAKSEILAARPPKPGLWRPWTSAWPKSRTP